MTSFPAVTDMLEGRFKEVANVPVIKSVVDVTSFLAMSNKLFVSEDSQLVGNR